MINILYYFYDFYLKMSDGKMIHLNNLYFVSNLHIVQKLQFKCICIAPDHTNSQLKARYTAK